MSPSDPRILLSDRALAAVPLMLSGQRIVRDAELLRFFVLVRKTTKTFMVEGDLCVDGKRQSIRVKVGEVGRLQTREAREGQSHRGLDHRRRRSPPLAADAQSATRSVL